MNGPVLKQSPSPEEFPPHGGALKFRAKQERPPSLPLRGLGGAAGGGRCSPSLHLPGQGLEGRRHRGPRRKSPHGPPGATQRCLSPGASLRFSPSTSLRRLGNTASSAHPRIEALRLGIPGSARPGLLATDPGAPLGRAPAHLQPRRRRRLPHPAARNGDRVL